MSYSLVPGWTTQVIDCKNVAVFNRDKVYLFGQKHFLKPVLSKESISVENNSLESIYIYEKLRLYGVLSDIDSRLQFLSLSPQWSRVRQGQVTYYSQFTPRKIDTLLIHKVSEMFDSSLSLVIVDVPSLFEIPDIDFDTFDYVVFIKSTGMYPSFGPIISKYQSSQIKALRNLAKDNSVSHNVSIFLKVAFSLKLQFIEDDLSSWLDLAISEFIEGDLHEQRLITFDLNKRESNKFGIKCFDVPNLEVVSFNLNPLLGNANEQHDYSFNIGNQKFHVISYSLNTFFKADIINNGRLLVPTVGGKGFDFAEALGKAKSEVLERSCFYKSSRKTRFISKASDLDDDFIEPNILMSYSHNQYIRRDLWNSTVKPGSCKVLMPYEDQEIEWSEMRVYNQSSQVVLFPTSWLFLSNEEILGEVFCGYSSIGSAFSEKFELSIYRAVLELLERDAVGIWWYNKISLLRLSFESIPNSWGRHTQMALNDLNLIGGFMVLKSDFPVHVVVSIASCKAEPEKKIFGFGVSNNIIEAIKNSSEELLQMIPNIISSRKKGFAMDLTNPLHYLWDCYLVDHGSDFLDEKNTRGFEESSYPIFDASWETNFSSIVKRIEDKGDKIYFYEESTKEGTAVKVFINGLCSTAPRFGQRRMFEIPVVLYQSSSQLDECQLNPVPFAI